MQLVLRVLTGPRAGRKIVIKSGQFLRVGRTEWADFSIPEDADMADVHFSIDCGPAGCRLSNLEDDRTTLVNGEEAAETELHHGDRIMAGQTTLEIETEGEIPDLSAEDTEAATSTDSGFAKVAVLTAAEVCRPIDLDDDARAHYDEQTSPREYLDRLIENELLPAAVKFLAHALPKREAVWWACLCVGDDANGSDVDTAALKAARAWVIDPSNENRRGAESAAAATTLGTPAGCAAMAAFFSGGSLSPPDLPEVPPGEYLTAGMVTGAVMMAVVQQGSDDMAASFRNGLDIGRAVADGNELWDD